VKKKSICFLNGRFLETARAGVPATDRGFLFGEALFETWKTYRGKPFALPEHLTRMAKAAKILGIPFDPKESWENRSLELARRNGMADCGGAVRLTISAGPGKVSLIPDTEGRPTRLMLFRPLEPGLENARHDGVGVHLMDFGVGVNARLRNMKTVNYVPAVMGKVAARKHRCFESLYRLADSTVLEGTTSNFFVVKRGKLYTTPVAEGILPGVTRALTLGLAKGLVPIIEGRLTERDLLAADEVFLTSSSIEVVPVIGVDKHPIADARPGEITRELQRRYRRLVSRRLGMAVEDLGV
jgi:branched-subunit amino acid aminotransferase/4-amino-4-deoxychorismate lyase